MDLYKLKDKKSWLILFVFYIFVYSSSFFSGPLWDDFVFIFNSVKITEAPHPFIYWFNDSGATRAWPLGYSIFWTIYQLFKESFFAYKFLSLLVHFVNFYLLRRIFSHLNFKPVYYLGSFLFLIHPIQVETISWIFQLNTILSLTYFLIAILLSLKANNIVHQIKKHSFYLLGSLFFFGSLLTKSYYAATPIIFYFIIQGKKSVKISYTVLAILFSGYMTYETFRGLNDSDIELEHQKQFQKKYVASSEESKEKKEEKVSEDIDKAQETVEEKAQAQESSKFNIDFEYVFRWCITKLSTISQSFSYYTFNFVIPLNLQFVYSSFSLDNPIVFSFVFLFTIIYTLLAMSFIKKEEIKLNVYEKGSLVYLLLVFIPISGIFYVPFMKFSHIADHWAYSMSIPFAILLTSILNRLCQKYPSIKRQYLAGFVFIFFVLSTMNYCFIFNDHEKMILRNIRKNPQSYFLNSYLAHYYYQLGNYSKAYLYINKAIRLNPKEYSLHYRKKIYEKKIGVKN